MSVSIEYDGSAGIERPTGVLQAVLSNVVDLGDRDDRFNPGKKKHQIILIWQLAETYEFKGKTQRFQQTEFATLTLNNKSKLRAYVEGMLGLKIEDLLAQAKAKGNAKFKLDIEKLIGRNCMLTLAKKDSKSGEEVYTTVQSVAPLMKGMTPIKVENIPIPEWVLEFTSAPGTADAASPEVNMEDVMKALQ